MPTIFEIADALAPYLERERYHREGDPAGVWIGSDRAVKRLVLRLEAGRPPYTWASDADAVLIHRPFGLWPARLPNGVGVLAVHRALDERHSIGVNSALAKALGLTPEADHLLRNGAPKGLIARVQQAITASGAVEAIRREFGGIEEVWGDPRGESVGAIALAGAMTNEMVRDAAARGATVYLTGQLRKPAREAVGQTGIVAVGVGQGRAEAWGLRRLGHIIQAQWPGVRIDDSGLLPL